MGRQNKEKRLDMGRKAGRKSGMIKWEGKKGRENGMRRYEKISTLSL